MMKASSLLAVLALLGLCDAELPKLPLRAAVERRGSSLGSTAGGGAIKDAAALGLKGGGSVDERAPSLGWPIFVSFMYFLSIAMTAPALPAFCNSLFAAGGTDKVKCNSLGFYGR